MQYNNKNVFKISFGNKTDLGKVRERNEDYLESFEYKDGNVFVICDGMGGHFGGEIASRLAASTIKNIFITNPKRVTSTYELIEYSLNEANRAVLAKSKTDSSLKGMGTTCIILVLKNHIAYYGHIGDSRLYLVRGTNIYQLTKDHSIVQDLVDGNYISDEDAEFHPRKNEITRALGIVSEINPEINRKGILVYENDIFILCTDGLSNLVSEREMMEVVLNNVPIEACNILVDIANTAGGTDNITVQIVKVIKGKTLPRDFINVVPEGAIVKSDIKRVDNVFSDDKKHIKTKRPIIKYLYILIPLLGLILVVLLKFLFIKEDNSDSLDKELKSTNVKVQKELDSKIKEDLKSILEYIYLSKEFPTNVKFDRNKEFELIDRDRNVIKTTIDKLRTSYINKPFNKVKIQESNSEENKFSFVLENDRNLKYDLEFKIEENKIVFLRISFMKDVTPSSPVQEKKETSKPRVNSGKTPVPPLEEEKVKIENKQNQNGNEREDLPENK